MHRSACYSLLWLTAITTNHDSVQTIPTNYNSIQTIRTKHNSIQTIRTNHNSIQTIRTNHNSVQTIQTNLQYPRIPVGPTCLQQCSESFLCLDEQRWKRDDLCTPLLLYWCTISSCLRQNWNREVRYPSGNKTRNKLETPLSDLFLVCLISISSSFSLAFGTKCRVCPF